MMMVGIESSRNGVVKTLKDELRRLLRPVSTIAQVVRIIKMDGKDKAIVRVNVNNSWFYSVGRLSGIRTCC